MAHSITCDGCGCPVTEADMVVEGARGKAEYCPVCAAKYKAWEDEIFAKQTGMAREFEAFLKEKRAALKADGFKKLPDDPEG